MAVTPEDKCGLEVKEQVGLMSLTCRGVCGCSVGGQSTTDPSTDKKNQLSRVRTVDVCLGVGGRVRVQPIMVDCTKTCHC